VCDYPKSLVQHPLWRFARAASWFEVVSALRGRKMKAQAQKYKEISQMFKALAHPARLKLLESLMSQECCVGEIQKCLALSQPNVSQHLNVLKKAGIIIGKREKNKICYKISDNRVREIYNIFKIGEK
jgi:DNA-binding transcriptional ArsR family regulator